jgi:hypothetical protein
MARLHLSGHPHLAAPDGCSDTEGMDNTGTDDESALEELLALVSRLPKERQIEIAALVKRVAAEPDPEIRAVMIEESEDDRTSGWA